LKFRLDLFDSQEYLEHHRSALIREVRLANRFSPIRIKPKLKKFIHQLFLGKLYQPIEFLTLIEPILESLSANKLPVRVLDVGGGGGDNYLLVRRHIGRNIKLHWYVRDTSNLFDKTSDIRNLLKASVAKSDKLCALESTFVPHDMFFDLILIRGVLQYMVEDDLKFLSSVSKKYLIIDRTLIPDETLDFNHLVFLGKYQFLTHYKGRSLNEILLLLKGHNLEFLYQSLKTSLQLETTSHSVSGYISTLVFMDREHLNK
jgi:SAM-dependent methyltransferase